MPSGVKKRKAAARKKKEKEAKISSSRNEDFKNLNGRSSESREVNAIYDHRNCHNNGNNDKLEKNYYDALSVLCTVVEDKSLCIERTQGNKETIHELGFDGNGVVEVEKELTLAKNNACHSISIEYVESGKKFDERDYENSSSSSSSSSAEECSITDKKAGAYTSSYKINVCDDKPDKSLPATVGINDSASVGECINSLVETTLVADSVKSEVPVSTEKIFLVKVAAGENLVVSDAVTSGLKEDANTLLSDQCNGTRASSFTNLDSLPKDNGDKVVALPKENDQIASSFSNLDSLPKENGDRVSALPMENDQITSSKTEQGSNYLEGMTFLSSVSPAVDASKEDAINKDSEIPICTKNQTSAPAPTVAQRTSIFSCCGLFDLLKGSN